MTNVAKNDVTGDEIRTKSTSNKYRDNWDAIFRKNVKDQEQPDRQNQREQNDFSN